MVSLQAVRQGRAPASELRPTSFLYITSPGAARRLALSYKDLLADIYWIRLVQYYGSTRLSKAGSKDYDLLYPFLDLTTTLDPRFSIAYRFGAFFLSEPQPGGAGRQDLAIRLLEKGIAASPDRWEYPHDVAFLHYRSGDYVAAAEWYRRAADVPGAPNWLRPVAAVMLTTGGKTDTARMLWRNMLESDGAEWLRDTARFRLRQLDTIDLIAALERVTTAPGVAGRGTTWESLVRAGVLREVPRDTAGHPLLLDPQTGRVTIDRGSPLWPLPTADRP